MRFSMPSSRGYQVKIENDHLLDILEKGYYIELGIISYKLLEQLLHHQPVSLVSLIDRDLANIGTGKLTDLKDDFFYQLRFLESFKAKDSSNQYCITAGELHFTENSIEKYAPVILLPVSIDFSQNMVYPVEEPIVNPLLVKKLLQKRDNEGESNIQISGEGLFMDIFASQKFPTIFSLDSFGEELGKNLGMKFELSNYLTLVRLDYQDIVIEKDYLNLESSVYETTAYDIMKKYYDSSFSFVYPTNVYQKYIINKVLAKENFAVDGRLGSGKTDTIINLMADSIFRGKKVLYVNHDMANINRLEQKLYDLGLENVVCNLTHDFHVTEKKELATYETKVVDILPLLEQAKKYQQFLSGKIHGFVYSDLMERLTIVKNIDSTLTPIIIEPTLERYEVEDVARSLETIERNLKLIDSFEENIWKDLQDSHNSIVTKDIVERTQDFFLAHGKFYHDLLDFTKQYDMEIPSSSSDFYQLCLEMASFKVVKPVFCWENVENRTKAFDELKLLSSLSDNNFSCQNYYKETVSSSYIPGRVEKIYTSLCDKYLEKSKEDSIYINRLLVHPERLDAMKNDLEKSQKKVKTLLTQMKNLFLKEEFTQEFVAFLQKLTKLFQQENDSRVYEYLNQVSSHDFMNQSRLLEQDYLEIQNIYCNEILPYLFDDQCSYEEFMNIFSQLKNEASLKKYLKIKQLKQKRILVKDVYASAHAMSNKYADALTRITYVKDSEKTFTLLQSHLNVFYTLEMMKDKEVIWFQNLLKKVKKESKNGVTLIKDLLDSFEQEQHKVEILRGKLAEYKIPFDTANYSNQVDQMNEFIQYLTKVLSLRQEVTRFFYKKDAITYKDLINLMDIDHQYLQIQQQMMDKKSQFEYLFGTNYHGFDTVISDIVQSLEHFANFSERFTTKARLEKALKESFAVMSQDVVSLTLGYNKWISTMRLFSKCFSGGKSQLQDNSFDDVSIILKEYRNKLNQIDYVVEIIDELEKCKEYGLIELVDEIRNGKLKIELKEKYLLSTYLIYQKEYLATWDETFCFENIETDYQKLSEAEATKGLNNILSLQNHVRNYHYNPKNAMLSLTPKGVQNPLGKGPILVLCDTNTLNRSINIKDFDLVLVDDAQLGNVTKYHLIFDANQVVIFGDRQFKSSISNALMQRLNDANMVMLPRRYVEMSSKLSNPWSYQNQYIYSYRVKIASYKALSQEEFIQDVYQYFKDDPSAKINIVIASDETRRSFTSLLINKLKDEHSLTEITSLLRNQLMIVNGQYEASSYVDHSFIFYDDFKNREAIFKTILFSNYAVASKTVQVYYLGKGIELYDQKMAKEVDALIGKTSSHSKHLVGIAEVLYQRIHQKYNRCVPGFGCFDIILKGKNTVGIFILGKYNTNSYSMYDDYEYYKKQYELHGWNVLMVSMNELYTKLDDVVNHAINLTRGDENGTKS